VYRNIYFNTQGIRNVYAMYTQYNSRIATKYQHKTVKCFIEYKKKDQMTFLWGRVFPNLSSTDVGKWLVSAMLY